jgi:hypothetical protein
MSVSEMLRLRRDRKSVTGVNLHLNLDLRMLRMRLRILTRSGVRTRMPRHEVMLLLTGNRRWWWREAFRMRSHRL